MHTATTNHPCPRDGHSLTSVADNGLRMESCGSCGGLWVPMAQLTPRLSKGATALLFHVNGGRETQMRCPIDGAAMHEFDVGGVHIDRCDSCRGLWFDPGELATVLSLTGFALPKKSEPGAWKEVADSTAGNAPDLVIEAAVNSDGLLDVAGDVISAIVEFLGDAISL